MNMKKYLSKEYFLENKEKCLKAAVIIVILMIALAVFIAKNSGNEAAAVTEGNETEALSEVSSEKTAVLVVDVSGAVKTPSVVELPPDSRVEDAIEAAGGLKKNADITNVNRAAFVSDGEKILIPSKQRAAGSEETVSSSSGGMTGGKVNINQASSEELQTLNGVGPATAAKIIEYREQNGSFQKIEDIQNISGIGEKTFEKLKAYITV